MSELSHFLFVAMATFSFFSNLITTADECFITLPFNVFVKNVRDEKNKLIPQSSFSSLDKLNMEGKVEYKGERPTRRNAVY